MSRHCAKSSSPQLFHSFAFTIYWNLWWVDNLQGKAHKFAHTWRSTVHLQISFTTVPRLRGVPCKHSVVSTTASSYLWMHSIIFVWCTSLKQERVACNLKGSADCKNCYLFYHKPQIANRQFPRPPKKSLHTNCREISFVVDILPQELSLNISYFLLLSLFCFLVSVLCFQIILG